MQMSLNILKTQLTFQMIRSVYEDGFWWVEIPDDLWKAKEMYDWVEGIPIYVKR